MNRGPIYLAGADRSGTTLTYALQASHSNIAMTSPESNMSTLGFVCRGGNSSFERFESAQITAAAVERSRKALSQRKVAFIQACAGREMREFDYRPEKPNLNWREAFCFITWTCPPILPARFPGARLRRFSKTCPFTPGTQPCAAGL
jgi:hypothetical protein